MKNLVNFRSPYIIFFEKLKYHWYDDLIFLFFIHIQKVVLVCFQPSFVVNNIIFWVILALIWLCFSILFLIWCILVCLWGYWLRLLIHLYRGLHHILHHIRCHVLLGRNILPRKKRCLIKTIRHLLRILWLHLLRHWLRILLRHLIRDIHWILLI